MKEIGLSYSKEMLAHQLLLTLRRKREVREICDWPGKRISLHTYLHLKEREGGRGRRERERERKR